MKTRSRCLALLLAVILAVSMMPGMAFAAEGMNGNGTEGMPCQATEGCILEEGHEGSCVTEQEDTGDAVSDKEEDAEKTEDNEAENEPETSGDTAGTPVSTEKETDTISEGSDSSADITPADTETDTNTKEKDNDADAALEELQKQIDNLPDTEALAGMNEEEQKAAYAEILAVYDAVEAAGDTAESLDLTKLEAATAFFTGAVQALTAGNEGTVVAKVGDAEYTSLKAAFEQAPDNSVIVLTENISGLTTDGIAEVPAEKTYTLDMNGKTISVASSFAGRPIVNRGNLTITGNGRIDSSASDSGGYGAVDNYGTLVIENGTYTGSVNAGGASVKNRPDAVLTIQDGTFNGAVTAVYNEGKTYIYGGTFDCRSCSSCNQNSWGYTIQSHQGNGEEPELYFFNGEVIGVQGAFSTSAGYSEIRDGSFTTVACAQHPTGNSAFYALYIAGESGEVESNIYGGTFTSATKVAALIGNTNDGGLKENAIAHFYGGTFIGGGDKTAVNVDYPIGGLEITGGTYSSDVTAYVPAGNSVTSDGRGNCVVELDTKTAVVEIDGAGYTSMQAAVDAIAASHSKTGTITVQKDIPDAEGVSVPSGLKLTVDFAGYTYTLSGPGAGSTNTETNGFQLLKDSEIVFKNGTIKIAENANNIKRMIQSYADVTLENMRFEAENQVGGEDYALSFNHGNVVFKGDTSVITSSSDTIAFDVCFWTPYYPDGVSVTFADDYTGTVNGKILYDSTDEEKAELVIGGNGSFGSIETSSSSTEQPNIKISGGRYETSPVAYTTGDTVVLRYNNGSYAVGGTAQTVVASAADNSTIEVLKGSAAFSIGADNVTVKNNGDGTVTVNQITVE